MTDTPTVPRTAEAARSARSPRSDLARLALLACGAVVCAAYWAFEQRALAGGLGWPLDDSWIHLQFARNLAAGRGLSYNPGDLVTGSTAPLWTALLALLAYLPGSPLAWAQLLGVALYLAGIDAAWRLARELGLSRGLAALAGGLTLATGWLAWSALSGMEVPLFIWLSLWGMILHLRERAAEVAPRGPGELAAPGAAADMSPRALAAPPLAPAVLAVAALARPEGFLLLALAFVDRCLWFSRDGGADGRLRWHRPRLGRLAMAALLAVCALAGPLLFYRLAGGSFLPTTYAAKGGALRRWLPNLQYIYSVVEILARSQPYMTLLCCGGAVAMVARLGSRRDRGLLPALWLVGLPLAYSTLSPEGPKMLAGNFGRYYFPLLPVVVLLGAVALAGAAAALLGADAGGRGSTEGAAGAGGAGGGLRRLGGLLVAVLLLWPTVVDLRDRALFYARNLINVEASDVRAARWLAPRLPAAALLAVNDIGAFKYLLPNRVVDLAGIANPELRREVAAQVAAGVPWDHAMAAAVASRRPDYIAIFPAWMPHLQAQLGLRPLASLHIDGNITMGSDDLTIFSTPWTRYPLRRLPGDPEVR